MAICLLMLKSAAFIFRYKIQYKYSRKHQHVIQEVEELCKLKLLLLQVRVGHFQYLIYFLLLTKIILIIFILLQTDDHLHLHVRAI